MSARDERENAFFRETLALPPERRGAYLDQACAGDQELRRRVEVRLRARENSESHLCQSAVSDHEETVANTSVPEHPGEKPGDHIGRYRLLEQIGEGGMGVVYMAEQREPVIRKVALKIIKIGMDTRQVVARFEAERQALALMDHPNIAKVLDAGATDSGRPYFVMELVNGIPITRFCDEAKLDTTQRLELFTQVCSAIQHAHQKAVIHRDIKPSNVLVTLHGDQPLPKVIDFGIAKSTQQRLTEKTLFTQFQHFIGTPAYMSPEQASLSGLDIDTRSDIYALGVLLYELLTGKTPFDNRALLNAGYEEIQRVIREVEPPKPSTRLSTMQVQELTNVAKQRRADPNKLGLLIRGDLDWIVMKAIEKDRTRRYETANGLASDIRRFLKHEPVTAAAPSAAYRLRKFVQRNRTMVRLAATIVVLLVGGITVSTWLALLSARARINEATANDRLRRQVTVTEDALRRMQLQKAEELLRTRQASLGLAYLAQVLRANPSNRVASARLVSALAHGRLVVPLTEALRHGSQVWCAQFSPDGQQVVTASFDNTARVWDARTGQPLTEPLRHENAVVSAQFSPDGQRVVTASADNTARLWDARAGQPLTEPLRHENAVASAQFSPDGQRVATASTDNTARVWDARTSQPLAEPLRHENAVVSARFNPDGQRVVTASVDNTARVWDMRTGQPLTGPLRHENAAVSAQFSPDGQRVVTASSDNTARVWDARTGQPLTEPLRHEKAVVSAQFSPDGQRVVTASADNTARVWDARTGQPLTEPLRHGSQVSSAQFSPDGQRVVTASYDNTARVWDARTGQPLTEPLRHPSEVSSAQFSPDGQRVVTASSDNTARVWDARTGQPLIEPLRHENAVVSAQFSPDGQRVVTASADTARVWDARTGLPLTEPLRHESGVVSAQFSPDGQRVVTASADRTARVWDVPVPPVPVPSWFIGWTEAVVGQRLSPDGLSTTLSWQEALRSRNQIGTGTDFYTRLARWTLDDPFIRTISPFAEEHVPNYVTRRIQENTIASLREAIQLSPTNALAFARLAALVANEDPKQNPGRLDEAEFYAGYALKLDPNSTESGQILGTIQSQKGRSGGK